MCVPSRDLSSSDDIRNCSGNEFAYIFSVAELVVEAPAPTQHSGITLDCARCVVGRRYSSHPGQARNNYRRTLVDLSVVSNLTMIVVSPALHCLVCGFGANVLTMGVREHRHAGDPSGAVLGTRAGRIAVTPETACAASPTGQCLIGEQNTVLPGSSSNFSCRGDSTHRNWCA